MKNNRLSLLQAAADYILEHTGKAEICIVLGSGLGNYANGLQDAKYLRYGDIPGFPESTVQGHAGRLWYGTLFGKKVYVMQGRFHYYEGNTLYDSTLYVRVMKLLGVKTILLTNASGGINPNFRPGDLMLMDDHINMLGTNPLIGPVIDEMGPRFNDMTHAYTPSLRKLAMEVAKEQGIELQHGVYAIMSGPSYETPAEIRMLRILGADAVGMSTVPEAIVAANCGMDLMGISCITNMAAGVIDRPLVHQEVIETAKKVEEKFTALVDGIIKRM